MTIDGDIYQALAIWGGLRLYAATGMKPNASWTPKAMMATASQITGRTFKARDYLAAAAACKEWAETERAKR